MKPGRLSRSRSLVCGAVVACAFEATASAQTVPEPVLYGVRPSGGVTRLYRIDPETAVITRVGTTEIGFDNVHSMDADPFTGDLYATASRVLAPDAIEFVLLKIGRLSGEGMEVMSLGVFDGAGSVQSRVAVRPRDATIHVGWQGSGFGRIVPPGVVQAVPNQPIFAVQAFDFDSQRRLWGTYIEGNVFCIEPGSAGSCNPDEPFLEGGVRVTSMSFRPGTDELFVVGDGGPSSRVSNRLYTLDPTTGSLTSKGLLALPGEVGQIPGFTALAWHVEINTPEGDPTVTLGPVTLAFTGVAPPGTTMLEMGTTGPPAPAGFKLGDPPTYYDLTTTAGFDEIVICIDYSGVAFADENALQLMHFEEDEDESGWVDRTISIDPVNDVICARVDSLSPFAIFEPDRVADTTPPILAVPASLSADATGPSGAQVTFAASATDDSGTATVQCLPASGSTFAIGTTAVSCTATDPSGNVDADTFTVTVRGPAEQIVAMLERLHQMPLDPATRAFLIAALNESLSHSGSVARTCAGLRFFSVIVHLGAGRTIPPALAAQLIADATRIRAVLGCR